MALKLNKYIFKLNVYMLKFQIISDQWNKKRNSLCIIATDIYTFMYIWVGLIWESPIEKSVLNMMKRVDNGESWKLSVNIVYTLWDCRQFSGKYDMGNLPNLFNYSDFGKDIWKFPSHISREKVWNPKEHTYKHTPISRVILRCKISTHKYMSVYIYMNTNMHTSLFFIQHKELFTSL